MNLIQNNPFRLAGVFANTTARELTSQKSLILRSASIQRPVSSSLDFSFFDPINRSDLKVIDRVFAEIEQNNGKVAHALFWFVNGNSFDDIAFKYLYNDDKEKAMEIWSKAVEGKDVTAKNFACFNNYGTIKLLSANEKELKLGIEAKINLIESAFFTDFVKLVADETYALSSELQMQKFVDDLLKELKPNRSSSEIIKSFKGVSFNGARYFSQKYSEEPLLNIENRIESAKRKRKEEKDGLYQIGLLLYVGCRDELKIIKNTLGLSDFRFKVASDNLAKEVMNCAIDHFQEWKERKNPSNESLKLLKYAEAIAIDNQVKERITENINGIEEYEQIFPVKKEIEFIKQRLSHFQNLADTVSNANDLIEKCRPKLFAIKRALGAKNPIYLNLSSAVVRSSQGMLVTAINELQEKTVNDRYEQLSGFPTLKRNIASALDTSYFFSKMDKDAELSNHCNKNLNALKNLANQLNVSTLNPEEKLDREICKLENDLSQTKRTTFLQGELDVAYRNLEKIKEWQLFRSLDTRNHQISNQNKKIENIKKRAEDQKQLKIKDLEAAIDRKRKELKNLQK